MKTGRWLGRLYDAVHPEPLEGKILKCEIDGPMNYSPTPAVLIDDQERVVASGIINADGLGTFHVTHGDTKGVECLLQEVIALYVQAGYAYLELTARDSCYKTLASMNLIDIRAYEKQQVSADIAEMPWADIFFDLRTWSGKPIEHYLPEGYVVRPPESSERLRITRWLEDVFGLGWASEFDTSFRTNPPTSVIAVRVSEDARGLVREPVGFICFDVVRRGMASTIGVVTGVAGLYPSVAGSLMTTCFQGMKDRGYAYVILSGMSRRVGALRAAPGSWTIPGSYPGIFGNGVNVP